VVLKTRWHEIDIDRSFVISKERHNSLCCSGLLHFEFFAIIDETKALFDASVLMIERCGVYGAIDIHISAIDSNY